MEKGSEELTASKPFVVAEGRTPDYNSGKKAKKRTKRYRNRMVFWFVLFALTLLPIVALRLTGVNDAVAVYSIPMCLFSCIFAYTMMKYYIYTGRTGLEQLDEKGSPFLGRMVYKSGFMRIENFLLTIVFLLIMMLVCFSYNFILVVFDASKLWWGDGRLGLSSIMYVISAFVLFTEFFAH